MEIIHPFIAVEGDPILRENVGKVRAEYVAYLFNDYFLYGIQQKHKVKYGGRYNLMGLKIEDMPDDNELYNAAKFILPLSPGDAVKNSKAKEEVHIVIFPTQHQKRKWLPLLHDTVHSLATSPGNTSPN